MRALSSIPGSVAVAAIVLAVFGLSSCEKSTPPPGGTATSPADGGQATPPPSGGERSLAVPDDHPLFGRYEGEGFANDCQADTDCHAGGCSGEVCSADEGVITTCDVPPAPLPAGTQCGCVQSQCRWWNTDGATLAAVHDPPSSEPSSEPSADCGGKVCTPPQQCMEYYGIAGDKGPKFHSCEIPCNPAKGGCPEGTKCVTVADGPGNVCR